MNHIPKPRWEIDAKSMCPCGSGARYRRCCKGYIASASTASPPDHATEERAARTALTRYIGWVFRHTLNAPIQALIDTDVSALEGLADRLAFALYERGERQAILDTFEHIKAFVPLPGLAQRFTYLNCIWMTIMGQDSRAAGVLSEFPSHQEIRDLRLLQLYLDMRSDALTPTEQLGIARRITAQATSPSEKLQYSCVEAMLTVLTGEQKLAEVLLDQAMKTHFEAALAIADTGDLYASWTCARALELRGTLIHDEAAFRRGAAILAAMPMDRFTVKGTAAVEYKIGLLHLGAGEA